MLNISKYGKYPTAKYEAKDSVLTLLITNKLTELHHTIAKDT